MEKWIEDKCYAVKSASDELYEVSVHPVGEVGIQIRVRYPFDGVVLGNNKFVPWSDIENDSYCIDNNIAQMIADLKN